MVRLGGNGSERETHDALTTAACRDQKTHEDICLGLLASILTEPPLASKVKFKQLFHITSIQFYFSLFSLIESDNRNYFSNEETDKIIEFG